MVSKPDKEYTKYDNIKTGKPFTKKELSLPSLIPELVDPKESELCFSPAIKRLRNLPKIAFSTLVHAHTNHASLDEKYRLRIAFTAKCLETMHAVTEFASACQNNDLQSRNDFIEKYRSWELRLRQTFEQWLLGKNGHYPGAYLDHNPFFKLLQEQDVLHRKALMMATIEAEHSSSGEFVSRLISVKADPAKKPAETKPDTAPAKPERESWPWRLYEKTLKVIVDVVLERLWPK